MHNFNPTASHSDRAVQAWQILVGKAMNRQTITYQDLSILMYRRKAPGVLADILGHIAFLCIDNNFPPLTSIVVGKQRGRPGEDIPVDPTTLDQEREKVYQCDWYDIYPPSKRELAKAYTHHMRARRLK
jgi:hypothetical protein